MKKFLSIFAAVVLMFSSLSVVSVSASDIKILIDNEQQVYDVMPVIENGRTLVPMRGIFESLGASVQYEDATRTVIGTKGNKTVILQINNTVAYINNEKIQLDVAPSILNSRTMVPVRFISEALGAVVDWDDSAKTVIITTPVEEVENKNEVVIIDWNELKRNHKKMENGYGLITFTEDELNVSVTKLPPSDVQVNIGALTPLGGIEPGDVCLMSFKAKLNSGIGYVKPWVQADAAHHSEKAVFGLTALSNEWADCYIPFVGIEALSDCGIRFGGTIQNVSIKDFKLVNYKNTKTIEELPSTIVGKAVVGSPTPGTITETPTLK